MFRRLTPERQRLSRQRDDILRAQIEVANIAAPTGAEGARARWVAHRMRALGLATRHDSAGNVVGRAGVRDDRAAPVVVCAHLDTVFPTDTVLGTRHDGTRVIGPGICDNARGLAVMLAIAAAVRRFGAARARAVEFVATTGEEGAGDLRGAKQYFTDTPAPFAVIALDGAGDERIVNTALGSRRFRISYRGPGGHSWAAFGAANAVHAAGRATAALATFRRPNAASSSLTVGRIGGGLSVNSIPADAWLEVDARSTSDATLARLEQAIREIAASAAAEENERRASGTPPLAVHVERIGLRAGGVTAEDSALVLAAVEATRLVGRQPTLATASTDANAALGTGAPAIAIGGGGRGGDAHSTQEWFDDTDSTAGVDRALTIVAAMATLARDA
ncbi:MAG: M20/M25/M40 family metallo-hydrolase [Gemmatimonadaceae bacterium]